MNEWHLLLCHVRIAVLRESLVLEIVLLEAGVARAVVRDDVRARRDGRPRETDQ